LLALKASFDKQYAELQTVRQTLQLAEHAIGDSKDICQSLKEKIGRLKTEKQELETSVRKMDALLLLKDSERDQSLASLEEEFKLKVTSMTQEFQNIVSEYRE